jgi:hypothetical protein
VSADTASAADLKSLHHLPRTRAGDFKSISGTGIKYLLVPFWFSKFVSELAALDHELRKPGTKPTAHHTKVSVGRAQRINGQKAR